MTQDLADDKAAMIVLLQADGGFVNPCPCGRLSLRFNHDKKSCSATA